MSNTNHGAIVRSVKTGDTFQYEQELASISARLPSGLQAVFSHGIIYDQTGTEVIYRFPVTSVSSTAESIMLSVPPMAERPYIGTAGWQVNSTYKMDILFTQGSTEILSDTIYIDVRRGYDRNTTAPSPEDGSYSRAGYSSQNYNIG